MLDVLIIISYESDVRSNNNNDNNIKCKFNRTNDNNMDVRAER